MTVKVSVIIPTYSSPPELDDVVAALDAQSLPASEFEVIFVDDGSPDGTFARLQDIAAQRTNVIARQIENSGWPSRPRNVGIDIAQGEYVFFSDHDDYIFPEALERMYAFAAANQLDVVHPKEVVQGWSTPGWVSWRQQRPLLTQLDQASIQCITPHKLYRRAFLDEAQIRFPEDTARLEDFNFNGYAWVRTNAIGVLSDYPCYRWVIYDDNSHKKGYDYEEYWKSFRNSLKPIVNELPSGEKRNQLLLRWYRSRMLERLNGQFQGHPQRYQSRLLKTFNGLLPLFPEELDSYLSSADRPRSYLLRQGMAEQLNTLSTLDHGLKLAGTSFESEWRNGRHHISLTARIVDPAGEVLEVETRDGRVLRVVPQTLREAGPQDMWDLTDELQSAFGELVVRHRASNVDWIISSSSELNVVDRDQGGQTIELSITGVVDPQTAAMGLPLNPGVWDVFYRVVGLGYTGTHRIPVHGQPASAEHVSGRKVNAFPTRNGFLGLNITVPARPTAPSKETTEYQRERVMGAYLRARAFTGRRLSPGMKQKLKEGVPPGVKQKLKQAGSQIIRKAK